MCIADRFLSGSRLPTQSSNLINSFLMNFCWEWVRVLWGKFQGPPLCLPSRKLNFVPYLQWETNFSYMILSLDGWMARMRLACITTDKLTNKLFIDRQVLRLGYSFNKLIVAQPWKNTLLLINQKFHPHIHCSSQKRKTVPLHGWSGPEDSRKLRFPDFVNETGGW